MIIASFVWNILLLQEKTLVQPQADVPAQILSLMPLKPASAAFASSKGVACILQQGDRRQLVVYLYELPATRGSEAYQVWMLQDGVRSNAGTFRVQDNGLGVLILDMRPEQRFDAIGVTLEPDAVGSAPRGSKVVGS